MRNTMAGRSHGRRALVIALGAVLAVGVPLGAQQPAASAPPAGQVKNPAPAAKVLQLSMDQAVTMAMDTNLGLKSSRLNVDVAAQSIVSARASFLPQLRFNVQQSGSSSVPSSFTDISTGTITRSGASGGATVSQQLPWLGQSYSVAWSSARSSTSAVGAPFNPTLSSALSVNFSQPLLQGFKIDGARTGLQTSERQREIADLDLEAQIVTLQSQVRDAYLNLVSAVEGRKVVGQNMESAQQQLDRTLKSVAVGTVAQIEVIQARANVANNEVSVIGADSLISTAQDALRTLIMDPARPDYWDVQFETTDAFEVTLHPVDVNAVLTNALANRIDLIEARKNISISDLNLRLDHELTKPAVNAVATYAANGTGGTQNTYTQTFPPVLVSSATKGFGSILADTFAGAYPSWTVGVNVTYPIGTTSAQSNLARAQVQKHQQEINLRSLELQVTASVRQAVRDVATSYQRAQATKASLEANQQQYDAEKRKLEVGLSDTFQVLQKDVLLASARLSDLSARIQYSQALLALERVQRIR